MNAICFGQNHKHIFPTATAKSAAEAMIHETSGVLTSSALYAISPLVIAALALAVVRLITTWNYNRALKQYDDGPHSGQSIVYPAVIPYSIPWLGHTTSFLSRTPGHFWAGLFKWHPRSTGICTLLVGGKKTHIVYSPAAVQALFRAKTPNRDAVEKELFGKVFLMPPDQIQNAAETKHIEHETNAKYLTSFDKVNELTAHFTRVLEDVLKRDARDVVQMDVTGLYSWVRDRMFTASVTALMGEKLPEMYPAYCEDFFNFDNDFMSFFFQLPDFMMRDPIARRKRILDTLERWSSEMHRSGGPPVDPDGPAWEPFFGSRLNRARQIDYKTRGLNSRSAAALNLGITFGLSSNVIPSVGWMLFHIIDPQALRNSLPGVLTEIREAEQADGSLDIARLVSQPLLQSIWTETLRMYTDVLVSRTLTEDLLLPLDQDGKRVVCLRKGENIFAPSWVAHHDSSSWSTGTSPYDVFDAERFLVKDPQTGRDTFTMSKVQGKFLPFGGGRTICPGRVFAKQEALGALAIILLRFDFDFKGFVDVGQKPTQSFPQFLPAFPGSGALAPGGDFQVKIRRRE